MKAQEFDSIIFDMDGTLWDAVDSYRQVWMQTFEDLTINAAVSRQQLIECMGKTIDEIFEIVIADKTIDRKKFLDRLAFNEMHMMPKLGGKLYPGVEKWIPELAKEYRLFMVSNCGSDGLHNFLRYTALKPYFTDTLTYCQTGLQKEGNINLLRRCHALTSPIYVGDTAGDCRSAHAAGIPIVFAEWGFGFPCDAEYRASSIEHLARLFLS